MTTTPTTNYAWAMPDVGSEVDSWGTVLRTLVQSIDTDLFNRIGNPGTNRIAAVVGSAAAPSYTFTGDTDTGIYWAAANTIGFSTNAGANIMTFSGAGLNLLPTAGVNQILLESTNNAAQVVITGAVASVTQRATVLLRKNHAGAVVVNGEALGGVTCQGYDGAAYQDSVVITGLVDEVTPGPTAMGGRFRVRASPAGTVVPTQLFDATHANGLEFEGNIFLDANRLQQLRSTVYGSIPAGATGKIAQATDNGGGMYRYNGTAWVNVNSGTAQTISTDVAFTLTPGTSGQFVRHTGTLTANRAVTLGTMQPGDWFHITRTGGGAFTLDVGTGPLKSLATNTWGLFVANAAGTPYLAAYGAL